MDTGEETIIDDELVAHLRATAKSINRRSLVVAAIITLVALLFP